MKQFVDRHTLALLLDVDYQTIKKMSNDGKIPHYRVGRHYRYVLSEVLAAIKRESSPIVHQTEQVNG